MIYAFIDNNHLPYYIGYTNDFKRRVWEHQSSLYRSDLYKYRKSRKLIKSGYQLTIIILEDNIPTLEEAEQREIYYINRLRERNISLCNLTSGGDGRRNFIASEETRKRISQSKKGSKWGHHSEETKRRMSTIRMGIQFTDEHKRNLSIARKRRIISKETRIKMHKSTTGKINIKQYEIISPEGKKYLTTNGLTQFCKEYNLSPPNMVKVANGERHNHKGWICKRI